MNKGHFHLAMQLDIWSILILLFLAQGLYLLSALVLSTRERQRYWNRFLAGILLAVLWWLMEFLSVRNVLEIPLNAFYGTRYGSWLLLGPLTYFYFKSIIRQDWRFSTKDSLHFLPFFLLVLVIPFLSGESLSQRQIHYGMLAVFDYRPKVVTPFEYFYSTVFYLQFVHLAVYLLFNVKRIEEYGAALKNQAAQQNELQWLRLFNGLLLLALLFVSIFLYLLFQSDVYRRAMDYLYVLPLGLFVYAASYKLAGVQWTKVELPQNKYQGSSLKTEAKSQYLQQLEQLMKVQKPHLKPELRLKDLAEMLQIPTHHLSQLINEQYKRSFFDFINAYRVKEAQLLIQQQPEQTLLQIAFAAGFNNKTSFVNAFKKFVGRTPSAYRKIVAQNS
ncbi:MAG: helix-turn-helix domain-containing protein [Bacteroidota bacterium]